MDLTGRLDPEIAAVFPHLPVLDLTDIPTARTTMMDMLAAANAGAPPSPDVVRQDYFVPGLDGAPDVRVRHYRPAGQSGVVPCLYWIHGGGHVLGQIEQDDPMMDHIVATVGCAAVSVDWRRPPEHPFPAPMDDCYAGLAWTYRNAAGLDVDPGRIAVGGASSGGGSAAGLALLARDRGEVPVCFQLLVYPMLDDRNVTPASREVTEPKVWNRESNLIGWRAYVGEAVGTDQCSPYAAPDPRQRPAGPAARLPPRGRPGPVHRRGHRVRPASPAGRCPRRAARLPGRHPRLRPARARVGARAALHPRPRRGRGAGLRAVTGARSRGRRARHPVAGLRPGGPGSRRVPGPAAVPDRRPGSFAHFQLEPGQTANAVSHATVGEIWYVIGGRGTMWRRPQGRDPVTVDLEPGVCLTIPVRTAFQFRAHEGGEPLAVVAVTMPPWPSGPAGEARPEEGPWTPGFRR